MGGGQSWTRNTDGHIRAQKVWLGAGGEQEGGEQRSLGAMPDEGVALTEAGTATNENSVSQDSRALETVDLKHFCGSRESPADAGSLLDHGGQRKKALRGGPGSQRSVVTTSIPRAQ